MQGFNDKMYSGQTTTRMVADPNQNQPSWRSMMANQSLPNSNSESKTCSIDGCPNKYRARGFCHTHYERWMKWGTADKARPTLEERFWAQVQKTESCWLWTGKNRLAGYGRIKVERKSVLTHRLSFAMAAHGRMPDRFVLHSCDNRLCVNPLHLREGSHQDNMNDMKDRGRHHALRGSKISISKLTEKDIPDIRAMLAQGITQTSVSKKYGVSSVCISCIHLGKTWGHVQ